MSQTGQYSFAAGSIGVETLTGNAGGAVGPVLGDIDILGLGSITVTGTPASHKLEISLSGTVADTFTTDAGSATPAAGVLTVAGGSNINTSGAASTVTINLDNSPSVSGTLTAGTGMSSTTGDITADAGDLVATLGGVDAATTVTGGTGIIATTGDITASTGDIISTLGAVNAATTVTAGTGISSTAGDITADAGDLVATLGDITADAGAVDAATTVTAGTGITATTGNITASTGDIISTLGAVDAATTVTAGTGMSSTTGDITADAGDLVATLGGVDAATTVTAGTGITATTGDITASTGDIIATLGNITASDGEVSASTTVTAGTGMSSAIGDITAETGDLVATLGDITASAGAVDAATTVTAGTGITATTGDITATAGALSAGANLDVTGTVQFVSITDGGLIADNTGLLYASGSLLTSTGFESWTGAGAYYDDTTLGEFDVLRGGTGYIKGVPVTWTGPQTVVGLTAGNTYYIYMDSTGTIGKTTTYNQALLEDYIVLFECLRDSTGINIQYTVKENNPYSFPVPVAYYNSEIIGSLIDNAQKGANITLNGTQKIEIVGADVFTDHGLYTNIPDSGGVAVTFNQMYTNGSGKWATYQSSDTFNGYWNNAGTPTAPTGTKFSVYTLYVCKDDLNSSTPTYWAVLDDQEYDSLADAQTAIADFVVSIATNELAKLEFAQLGHIIYKQSTTEIIEVQIAKSTLRETVSGGSGTNIAALITTNVTNFDGILSASDTTVQIALETIDEWGKTTTDHAVLIGNGTGSAIGSLAVGTDGQLLIGATGADPAFATVTSTDGTITFTPGANSLVIEGTDATETQEGVVELATDAEVIDGTDTVRAIVPTSLKAKLGTQTDHGVLVGSGTTGALTALAVGTNGQLLIGSTGADPVFATVTSTDGTITFTPGAGSLVIEGTDATEIQEGVVELATDAEAIAGTDTSRAIVSTSLKAKLGTQTDHGVLVGSGTTAALTALAVGTNGQLLIGGTAADPAFATITSTDGSLTFTPGANALVIEGTAATETQVGSIELATDAEAIAGSDTARAIVPFSLKAKLGTQTDHGVLVGSGTTAALTALTVGTDGQVLIGATGADPAFATLTSSGGTITFTPGASTLNLESELGLPWSEVTGTSQSMVVEHGYILNNAAQVTATLPATAALGDVLRITGKGAGGWKLAQNAGQTIYFGELTTTTGATGYLESTDDRDSVELVCVTANNDFNVISVIGNITVA